MISCSVATALLLASSPPVLSTGELSLRNLSLSLSGGAAVESLSTLHTPVRIASVLPLLDVSATISRPRWNGFVRLSLPFPAESRLGGVSFGETRPGPFPDARAGIARAFSPGEILPRSVFRIGGLLLYRKRAHVIDGHPSPAGSTSRTYAGFGATAGALRSFPRLRLDLETELSACVLPPPFSHGEVSYAERTDRYALLAGTIEVEGRCRVPVGRDLSIVAGVGWELLFGIVPATETGLRATGGIEWRRG